MGGRQRHGCGKGGLSVRPVVFLGRISLGSDGKKELEESLPSN
jgi:hypothetical protein